MWIITIKSNKGLSNREKDFIADLIDNDAHKVKGKCSFILHDILEGKNFCEAIIEDSKLSIINIVMMLRDNTPYNISYRSLNI
ncbi:MAG: hypothetical protein ISS28_07285 [Candidatus Cloacimonetes bacterium]|nr:hypothetical protein [Candidatus Cloacimonadota bacterium]MBL7086877.1 hypothetical protein [Candidatus Cloacimonadota bacterium]